MPPEFECNREVILPASPEEVWEAVATEAGNAAWMFPNAIDPDGPATKVWDPPHRFVVRMDQGEWFNALEFQIEAREGGTSVLRYMHSGIFVDDWDSQLDAVQQHTDFYLHTLSEYLEHFCGRKVTYIGDVPGGILGPPVSAGADGFERLQRALGVSGSEGDAVTFALAGPAAIAGVIDYRRPNFLGVRSADALYRFFGRNAFGKPVGMSIHAFADDVDAEQVKGEWQRWLASVFA
jgi:hypothetical protein